MNHGNQQHFEIMSPFTMCVPPQRKKTWFEKRTNLEKQFLIILTITLFILILLVTFLFSMYLKFGFALKYIKPLTTVLREVDKLDKNALLSRIQGGNVCLTENCVKIASTLLDGMNTTVKPCDDFYELVCGNWIDKHTIPGNRGAVSNFDQLTNDISKEIKQIVEKDLPKLAHTNRVYQNLYDFWSVCNNETRQEMTGDDELKSFVEHKLGGWPIAKGEQTADKEEKLDLIDFHRKLDEHGHLISGLVQISTVLDVFNSSKTTILISPPSVSLHHKYLSRNSSDARVIHYFNLIKDSVEAYNPELKVDEKEVWKLIAFEKKLSNLANQDELKYKHGTTMHKGKISDLFIMSPEFPWSQFLELTFDRKIPDDHKILYTEKKYLLEFYQMINSTEVSVLKNYLVWRVVRHSITIMNDRWFKIIQKFYKQNYGFTSNQKNRTQFCYSLVYPTFNHLIDHLYVKRKPELNNKKQAVRKIAEAVQKQFIKSLKEVEWFDEETRARAISKALKTTLQIGYPSQLLNSKQVEEFYSKLQIEANSSFYRNMLILNRFAKQTNFDMLDTVNSKHDRRLFGSILTVNAFYSRFRNSVMLPIGILGRHVFNEKHPNYMNFASLGYIVGHELTHGFDEEGSRMDENGQHDWWKQKTRQQFQKKVDCIVNNYSNFTVYGDKKIRGKDTLNENIADIGGAKQAFYAYRNYLKGFKNDYRLPGLQQFNNEQMFWIFYANTWCGKSRAKQLILNAELGNHSMAKYRVIGVLTNSQEFVDSFKCAVGSRMNPRQQKCTVW